MGLVGHGPYLPQHITILLTILLALISCYPVSEQQQKRDAVTQLVTNTTSNATVVGTQIAANADTSKSVETAAYTAKAGVTQTDNGSLKKDDLESDTPTGTGDKEDGKKATIKQAGAEGRDKLETSKLDDGKPESGKLESGKVEDVVDKPGIEDAKNPANRTVSILSGFHLIFSPIVLCFP